MTNDNHRPWTDERDSTEAPAWMSSEAVYGWACGWNAAVEEAARPPQVGDRVSFTCRCCAGLTGVVKMVHAVVGLPLRIEVERPDGAGWYTEDEVRKL